MFTGLVEEIGTIIDVQKKTNLTQLKVRTKKMLRGVKRGDSIAVDGCCLTATQVRSASIMFDCMKETLQATTLGSFKKGSQVNLERALQVSDRLGGHIVSGHVDQVGVIKNIVKLKNYVEYQFGVKKALIRYIVPKGSISIDGISLTVGKVQGTQFSVYLIPETLKKTSIQSKKKGDQVNVEIDLIARYAEKLMKG